MRPTRLFALVVPALALAISHGQAAAQIGGVPGHRCGTPELLPDLAATPKVQDQAMAAPLGGKLVREGFGGTVRTVRESANFAVKWSSQVTLSDAQAQVMLDALELGWNEYANNLGMELPPGASTHKLNAYIVSGSGDNPGIDFDGGYAYIDNSGYAYFVMSRSVFNSGTESIEDVAVHELFHDFQFGHEAFGWGGSANWWWEATAEWGAQQTTPDHYGPYLYVGGFATLPHLSLWSYVPDLNDPRCYHQYGASIFSRFITEVVGDPQIIADTWKVGGQSSDPLVVLESLLPTEQFPDGLEGAFAEFIAHNAMWDYEMQNALEAAVNSFETTFPGQKHLTGFVLSAGTDGMVTVDASDRPRNFGYNTYAFSMPASRRTTIEFDGDTAGSAGSAATWHLTLIHSNGGQMTYEPVAVSGGAATIDLELPAEETLIHLVVGVTAPGRSETETFSYQYSVTPDDSEPDPDPDPDPDPTDDEDETGCCSTSGGGATGSAALALALVLGFGRRRRRAR